MVSALRPKGAPADLPGRPKSQAAKLTGLLEREQLSQGGCPHFMLASSPELLLLERPTGPTQLELMVSTMRSHLGTALTEASATDEARDLMKQDMDALVIQEVLGRGGQGVVFLGYLHGLETAVKVTVYRDGESLADDELQECGDRREASGRGGQQAARPASGAGSAMLVDLEEEAGARLRKIKRGAMEHALTPTLSHPSIVQVYAVFTNCVVIRKLKENGKPQLRLCTHEEAIKAGWTSPGTLNQVLCLEYCDCGTLLSAAHGGAFRPHGASGFAALVRPALVPLYTSLLEVALALRYLHARRLVHCDLKPANVLLKSSNRDPRGWTCKLSDFGCARLMAKAAAPPQCQQEERQLDGGSGGAGGSSTQQSAAPAVLGFRMKLPLGTLAYMAPECFIRDQLLDDKVDVYAFGIMMYELLTCQAPYQGVKPQDLPRQVARFGLRPEFHPLVPQDYGSLAMRCWSPDPAARPTACKLVHEIEQLLTAAKRDEATRQEQQSLVVLPAAPARGARAEPRQVPRAAQPPFEERGPALQHPQPVPQQPAPEALQQQQQLVERASSGFAAIPAGNGGEACPARHLRPPDLLPRPAPAQAPAPPLAAVKPAASQAPSRQPQARPNAQRVPCVPDAVVAAPAKDMVEEGACGRDDGAVAGDVAAATPGGDPALLGTRLASCQAPLMVITL